MSAKERKKLLKWIVGLICGLAALTISIFVYLNIRMSNQSNVGENANAIQGDGNYVNTGTMIIYPDSAKPLAESQIQEEDLTDGEVMDDQKEEFAQTELQDETAEENGSYEYEEDPMEVKLCNVEPAVSRYMELNSDGAVLDTVGNTYSPGHAYVLHAEGVENYGYGTFYLGEKYSRFTMTLATSAKDDGAGGQVVLKGRVEIYSKNGNEYNLLYQSGEVDKLTAPENVEIDIRGVEWFEIRFYTSADYYSLAGGYHSAEVFVADGTLYSE